MSRPPIRPVRIRSVWAVPAGLLGLWLLAGCAGQGPEHRPATPPTPMMQAAKKGDLKSVKKMVERGKDPNRGTVSGKTPLMEAVESGNLELVRYLVENGADVRSGGKPGVPQGLDGPGGYQGRTALERAAALGHASITDYLLDKGASVTAFALVRCIRMGGALGEKALNRVDDPAVAQSALVSVLRMGKWRVANRLLRLGATVHARDYSGNTPLHWAARHGGADVVAFLLLHGADINQPNRYREPPLDAAAAQNRPEMVRLLLRRGALVNRGAPLAAALQAGSRGVRLRQTPALVRYLLSRGADVNRREFRSGETPLLRAVRSGDLGLVRLLVRRGADVNGKSRGGLLPLTAAREGRHPEIAAYLRRKGAREPPPPPDSPGKSTPRTPRTAAPPSPRGR